MNWLVVRRTTDCQPTATPPLSGRGTTNVSKSSHWESLGNMVSRDLYSRSQPIWDLGVVVGVVVSMMLSLTN